MNFRYTKYAFYNALLSLIPIFPIWSLMIGVSLSELIRSINNDCERAYNIANAGLILLLLTCFFVFYLKLKRIEVEEPLQKQKNQYRLFSLFVYTLTNNLIFSFMMGSKEECYGQSDQILGAFYSGPIASLTIFIIGFIVDVYRFRIRKAT